MSAPRRLVNWLLRLYPPSLRRTHGEEMEEALRYRWARLETGPRRTVAFVFLALKDAGLAWRRAPATWTRDRGSRRPRFEPWVADVRYAGRRLVKSPTFTLVAALSLGLGIGANSAAFSIVNAVLFRSFPAEDVETLVDVYMSEEGGFEFGPLSHPDYRDLREQNDVFVDVVASRTMFAHAGPEEAPELVMGELVTGNYFPVLGIRPSYGRLFQASDDAQPGGHPVVVLGHDFFQRSFGGSPSVVGSEVRVNGRPFTVVGIAPASFTGTIAGLIPDVWVPMAMTDVLVGASDAGSLERRNSRSEFVKARLQDGVTVQQAADAVRALSLAWEERFPDTNRRRHMTAIATSSVSINPAVDRFLAPAAALLLGAVGLVLLVACTNLASFLLARAADRRQEVGIRLALGATRGRLVRQLLVESVLLGILGGLVGLVIAAWTVGLVVQFQPPMPFTINLDLGVDGRVLTWTGLISVGAGVLFGLAPAWQATRTELVSTLKGAQAPRRRGLSLRSVLVVSQVAVSLLLLVGAGLFVRSLGAAQQIDPGFDTGPAALLWPNYELSGYDGAEADALRLALEERLSALPGVTMVGMADRLPLGIAIQTTGVTVPGVEPEGDQDDFDIDYTWISDAYFAAMDVPILSGRGFADSDRSTGEPVAVVSEAFARRFWPGEEAVGRMIEAAGSERRVVGVAADTKVRTIGEAPRPYVYLPVEQAGELGFGLHVIVRGQGSSAALLETSRRAMMDAYPNLVLMEAKTMEEHLALLLFPPRMAALLLTFFGALALCLAGVGLYGIVNFAVSRRTREVGIRMSLGAGEGSVVSLLVSSGMKLVLLGTGIGLVLAFVVSAFMSRFLFGIRAVDPATFLGVPIILGAVALLASYLPARRASRVDPVTALRAE